MVSISKKKGRENTTASWPGLACIQSFSTELDLAVPTNYWQFPRGDKHEPRPLLLLIDEQRHIVVSQATTSLALHTSEVSTVVCMQKRFVASLSPLLRPPDDRSKTRKQRASSGFGLAATELLLGASHP
jgi:hypothetical protein